MGITENVSAVKENIARAAFAAGVSPDSISLVAATKMNSAERVREAIDAGIAICGENRVQELLEKYEQGAYEGAELHFIGVLQKNKVRHIVGKVGLIHSVDSVSLAAEIDKRAAALGTVQDILLEVNVGAEESKSGFTPEEVYPALDKIAQFGSIRVLGLMAIPPICASGEENRIYFRQMKQLFVDIEQKKYDNNRVCMNVLSMGMSSDYEIAVEEGATLVRVGTGIFGARHYAPAAEQDPEVKDGTV